MNRKKPRAHELLRDHRARLGWTLEELAEKCGINALRLWRLEVGKTRMLADDVEAIAAAMEMTVVEFYGGRERREARAS